VPKGFSNQTHLFWPSPLFWALCRSSANLEAKLHLSKYFVPVEQVATTPSLDAFPETLPRFTIITPRDPNSRGAQLSLLFLPESSGVMEKVFEGLSSYGVIGDKREPNVIRLTPAPLFNTDEDVLRAALCLEEVLDSLVTAMPMTLSQ
jgi:kynureninase